MNKRKKLSKILMSIREPIRFILRYIVPIIIIGAGISLSILLPFDYFYENQVYDIKKILYTTLPLLILLTYVSIRVTHSYLMFLWHNNIIDLSKK